LLLGRLEGVLQCPAVVYRERRVVDLGIGKEGGVVVDDQLSPVESNTCHKLVTPSCHGVPRPQSHCMICNFCQFRLGK
jgi:hypothetical protein